MKDAALKIIMCKEVEYGGIEFQVFFFGKEFALFYFFRMN